MKHSLMIACLPPLALLAACGSTETTNSTDTLVVNNEVVVNETETTQNEMAPMGDNMAAAGVMTGQQFADVAAASDAYEIESSKLAQERATKPAIKEFAAMLVKEHTDSTAKLKAAAAKASPPITPAAMLNPEQRANIDKLKAATGEGFDTEYKNQQLAAHAKALSAMQGYAQSGDVPAIKDFAATTAPVIEKHLKAAQGL